jgi:hypothetical protein
MAPPQRKKNKRAPKRWRPPWRDLFDGEPIERLFPRDHECAERNDEKVALAELDRRVARLAEHYGTATFRQLLLAVLADIDHAFTIIDPLPRPKGRQWVGVDGLVLLSEVECFGEALRKETGKEVKLEAILGEVHRVSRYRTMSPGHLNTAYHAAKRYHYKESPKQRRRKGTKRGAL